MKIHFSSSRGKTKSNFASRISRDQDSCQGLLHLLLLLLLLIPLLVLLLLLMAHHDDDDHQVEIQHLA